jgi:hypothetical protein
MDPLGQLVLTATPAVLGPAGPKAVQGQLALLEPLAMTEAKARQVQLGIRVVLVATLVRVQQGPVVALEAQEARALLGQRATRVEVVIREILESKDVQERQVTVAPLARRVQKANRERKKWD